MESTIEPAPLASATLPKTNIMNMPAIIAIMIATNAVIMIAFLFAIAYPTSN
jgi:hypothetical protein